MFDAGAGTFTAGSASFRFAQDTTPTQFTLTQQFQMQLGARYSF